MKIRTWCLETIPIRTYSTSSHSNLVNRTYCPKPVLRSLSISLHDTNFEEMALLRWFVENEWIEILLYL